MSIDEILLRAIELDSSSDLLEKYLDEQCGSDAQLRAQVESLLQSHRQAGSFLRPANPDRPTTMLPEVSEKPGSVIGRYKLLQQIGEGGFGIVFMAEQQQPIRRTVALKIIKPGMDTKDVVARFEAERQALAIMDHPNIARVLDGGATETGRPYFVMELVKGKAITEYCDANKLGVRERLKLHMAICQAVQHAHSKAVIHRDLKPSNVMITLHDGKPVVKVIDFGVSKALNQQLTQRTLFTAYGQMVGTPQYMSPEQAEMSGLDVDTRSDVYSLGVLLYELLTGSTPLTEAELESAAYAHIQRLICEKDPPWPSTRISTSGEELTILADHRSETPQRLHQLVRGDLDLIVMKALEKDRTRRYETAADLAKDIDRYLNDEPVTACPPSVTYRMWKFCRRNRGLVTAASLVALMLVVAVVGTTTGWIRAEAIRGLLEDKADELAEQGEVLQERTDEAVAGQQREKTLRQQADRDRKLAETERNNAERSLYMAQIQLAHQALSRPHAGTVEDTLKRWLPIPGRPDHRDWEWYYLLSQSRKDLVWTLHDHLLPVHNVTWAPDSRRFASVGEDGVVRIWDVLSGKQIAKLLHTGSDPMRVRWSPDGTTIATGHGDGTVHLWDGTSYVEKRVWEGHGVSPTWRASVESISFSQDGRRLASYGWDQKVRVCELDREEPVQVLVMGKSVTAAESRKDEVDVPQQVALSPDGSQVAAISAFTCRIWNVASGDAVLDLTSRTSLGRCIAWSPDGKRIAVGIGWDPLPFHVVRVFNVETGDELCKLRGHRQAVLAVGWDGTGERLVTASFDHTIRVWSAEDGSVVKTLQGHSDEVLDVGFSADDRFVVSGGRDGTVRVWNIAPDTPGQSPETTQLADARCVAWSPDGTLLALGNRDGTIEIWDAVTRQCSREMHGHTAAVFGLAWAPDGNRLASASADDTAKVWDARTGEQLFVLDGHEDDVMHVAWSPDGRRLATAGLRDGVRIWDANSGQSFEDAPERLGNGFTFAVDWDSASEQLASIGSEYIRVWEQTTGRTPLILKFSSYNSARTVKYSPSGRMLAYGNGHSIVLYDLDEAAVRCMLRGHTSAVNEVAWNSKGTRIASASNDGTVRIWDVSLGEQLLTFPGFVEGVESVAWSSDDQSLACACRDGSVWIWSASKGYALINDPTFITGQTMRRYQMAKELAEQGDVERAIELMKDVISWKPDDHNLLLEMGLLYMRNSQWDDAAECYAKATRIAPHDRYVWAGEAVASLRLGDEDQYRIDCTNLMRLARREPANQGLGGLCAWAFLLGYNAIDDIDGVRELMMGQLQYLGSIEEPAPWVKISIRFTRIRLELPTEELEESLRSNDSLIIAMQQLHEALRLIQLNRVQEAENYYQQAMTVVEASRSSDDVWYLVQCEILAKEVGSLLEKARKQAR